MLCAMIIPHMYSSGYAGSGRVINMYHSLCKLFAPVVCMDGAGAPEKVKRRWRRRKIACFALAAAALAVCLCGGQLRNYEKLVSDQLDGTQDAYIAQFQREYALCETAGAADDVVLPAWTVQTVTGKPTAYEDAAFWTNEAMAQYYGVKSVRVESEEMLELRKIDRNNVCRRGLVKRAQADYVASNIESILEAFATREAGGIAAPFAR